MSEKKKKYDYYKPNIPREVEEEIRKVIEKNPSLGYRNVVDFILEAIRDKIKEMKLEKEGEK